MNTQNTNAGAMMPAQINQEFSNGALFPGTIRVCGDREKPMFVAKDVCCALGFQNVSQTIQALDGDEKGYIIIDTLGGKQELLTVNQTGLYALMFRSNKSEAKKFRRWVTDEVIPSIFKTGSYTMPQQPALPQPALTRSQQIYQRIEAYTKAEVEVRQSVQALRETMDDWVGACDRMVELGLSRPRPYSGTAQAAASLVLFMYAIMGPSLPPLQRSRRRAAVPVPTETVSS